MMRLLALTACALLCGCASSRLYDRATGRKIADFQSDVTDGEYSDGATHFRFAKMSNSSPTRAAYMGIRKLADSIGTTAVGLAVPGAGTVPAVIKGATVTVPHFTNPQPTTP